MHVTADPGFSFSGIGSRSLRRLAAYAVSIQARPLDSLVYLAALAHTERRRPVA